MLFIWQKNVINLEFIYKYYYLMNKDKFVNLKTDNDMLSIRLI
jgi:hypothetical protein